MKTHSIFAKTLSSLYQVRNRFPQNSYQALKGASRMMREHRIGCVIFEFGQTTFDMGNDPAKLTKFIASKGYKLRNLIKGAPIFPGGESVAAALFSMHVCTPSPW